jgi:hypothetical protein
VKPQSKVALVPNLLIGNQNHVCSPDGTDSRRSLDPTIKGVLPNTGARSSSTAATSERAFLFEFHQVIPIDHSAFSSIVALGNTP